MAPLQSDPSTDETRSFRIDVQTGMFKKSRGSTISPKLTSGTAITRPLPISGPTQTKKDRNVLYMAEAAEGEGFVVDSLLGKGGMGAVFLAQDEKLNRKVALKFLHPDIGGGTLTESDLRSEAERASKLGHENIVQIYAWHTAQEYTFFSMEFVNGLTLSDLCSMEEDLEPTEALRIIAEAARGVEAAHAQGIMHRDIKPQNILISHDGRVKVTDFGIGSTTEERIGDDELDGALISGTIGYMSPEQANGKTETYSSDVFSLTATLYFSLTGMTPFGNPRNVQSRLEANQAGRMVPLYTMRRDLPPEIYPLVTKGLSKDAKRRFKTAEEFRRALEDVIFKVQRDTDSSTWTDSVGSVVKRRGFRAGFITGFIVATFVMIVLIAIFG